MRKLTQLKIDEVSCVLKGANPGARVLIRKAADDNRLLLFDDVMLAKAETDDSDENQIDPNDTPASLLPKLSEMVIAVMSASPGFSEVQALDYLLHSAHGRRVAEHLNNISKTERQPPMLDIKKLIPIIEDGLMAQVTKRDDETYAKSFSRKYENDISFRRDWAALTDAKHLLSLRYMATLTPTSTETGSSATSDDSAAAVRQLQEMADKQRRSFEQVFSDPTNRELAARTYTSAHRP